MGISIVTATIERRSRHDGPNGLILLLCLMETGAVYVVFGFFAAMVAIGSFFKTKHTSGLKDDVESPASGS